MKQEKEENRKRSGRESIFMAGTIFLGVVSILLGVLLISITPALLWLGIALFAATTLFSFITLPVEVNASQRAVAWLENSRITDSETGPMAKDALKWAAYTYVIAAIGSLATLLYYIGMARRN